jgi:hypothetical protein
LGQADYLIAEEHAGMCVVVVLKSDEAHEKNPQFIIGPIGTWFGI